MIDLRPTPHAYETPRQFRERRRAANRAIKAHLRGRMLWVSKPVHNGLAGPGRTLNIKEQLAARGKKDVA